MATIADFPQLPAGALYSRVYKPMPKMDDVTFSQTFEDKSRAVNAVTSVAEQTWELELAGLQPFEADVYAAHYSLAFHDLHDFSYTEKNGTTQTGVKYLKCEITHDANKSWIKKVSITLVKYPA